MVEIHNGGGLGGVDLRMLKRQKQQLVNLTFEALKPQQLEALDGIIHLLDWIQDELEREAKRG